MRNLHQTKLLALIAVLALLVVACGTEEPAPEVDETGAEDPVDDAAEDPADEGAEEEPSETPAEAVEWPHDEMTIIVPFDAGGGADTLARDLQPFLEEELGASITVENHPGAATQVGTTYFMESMPDDGSTLFMLTQLFFSGSIVLQDADYDVSDVSVVNTEVIDPVTVTVQADGPYETFDDLVEDIQARPGEVTWAGIFGAHSHLTGLMIEDRLDLDVRPVFFDGGGEQRNALMGGNTDYMMGTAVGDIAQEERLRVLAINADPDAGIFDLAPDAEPLGEALARYDADPVPQLASARSVAVHRNFQDANPELFDMLVAAYEAAFHSAGYQEHLEEAGRAEISSWRGHETSQELVEDMHETLVEFADVIAEEGS